MHLVFYGSPYIFIHIVGNLIINSDRGVGFGLNNKANQHRGGLIADNIIIHTKVQNNFADVGIALESSPDTMIMNNIIFMTTDYPNAIEYRFEHTNNVLIQGNITNKAIKSRNGGSAEVIDNVSSRFSEQMMDSVKHLFSQ